MKKGHSSGFTLLETLMAVAITGILAAGIFPLVSSMIIFPRISMANTELTDLRSAATHYYTTNNVSATSLDDLRAACPSLTGNYTVENGTVIGLAYPGLQWNGTRWVLKHGG